MKSMNSRRIDSATLRALYQRVTRGLPSGADRRLSVDEMLTLAAGETLGARQSDALRGVAESSDQAVLLRLLTESRALSSEFAAELHLLRQPKLMNRLSAWWHSANMPPVFAAAGIALMAVLGFQFLGSSSLPQAPTAQAPTTAPAKSPGSETPMFGGAFEAGDQLFAASLEHNELPDQVFGGNFDS